MKRTFVMTQFAISMLAITTARAGVLDDWGKPALIKRFFMEYRIKVHEEAPHITSITLDRRGKASGNAWFHGGECYCLMLDIARGPCTRVNFDKDVTTTADDIWVDTVTGNRLKGNDSEKIWRFEVDDKSGNSNSDWRAGKRITIYDRRGQPKLGRFRISGQNYPPIARPLLSAATLLNLPQDGNS